LEEAGCECRDNPCRAIFEDEIIRLHISRLAVGVFTGEVNLLNKIPTLRGLVKLARRPGKSADFKFPGWSCRLTRVSGFLKFQSIFTESDGDET